MNTDHFANDDSDVSKIIDLRSIAGMRSTAASARIDLGEAAATAAMKP
jgi:hypothetical protein